MNLTGRHVVWCLGLVVGGVVGAVIAPSWELAPFFVGFAGALVGAVSAQCAVYSKAGLAAAVLATIAGAAAMMKLGEGNPA